MLGLPAAEHPHHVQTVPTRRAAAAEWLGHAEAGEPLSRRAVVKAKPCGPAAKNTPALRNGGAVAASSRSRSGAGLALPRSASAGCQHQRQRQQRRRRLQLQRLSLERRLPLQQLLCRGWRRAAPAPAAGAAAGATAAFPIAVLRPLADPRQPWLRRLVSPRRVTVVPQTRP